MRAELPPDRSGTVLAGRYRLVERLGAGGMGEVYRAVNQLIGREVAIKILKPEHGASDDMIARILREARAANAVRHPNAVSVIDAAVEGATPYIVQELLTGEDLSVYLRRRGGMLTEPEALEVMVPVTDALRAAHAAGIMHRDLKPENVFLDRSAGTVVPKVLDFGLSRGVGDHAISRMTTTGVALGTPTYMSPEQVRGERDIDQRTDVWAIGVLLYELVAGIAPFQGKSLGDVFVQVCTDDPVPLRLRAPSVTDAYQRVVARCLHRDRARRFADAGEVHAALRAIQGDTPTLTEIKAPTMASLAEAAARDVPTFVEAHTPSIGPTVASLHRPPRPSRVWMLALVAAACLVAGLYATRRTPTAPSGVAPSPESVAPRPASPPLTPVGTTHYDPPPQPSAAPVPAPPVGALRYDPPVAAVTPTPVRPRRRLRRDARGDIIGGVLPGGGTATYDR